MPMNPVDTFPYLQWCFNAYPPCAVLLTIEELDPDSYVECNGSVGVFREYHHAQNKFKSQKPQERTATTPTAVAAILGAPRFALSFIRSQFRSRNAAASFVLG